MGAQATLTIKPVRGELSNLKFVLDREGREYDEQDGRVEIDVPDLTPEKLLRELLAYTDRAEILHWSSTAGAATVEVYDISGRTDIELSAVKIDEAESHGFEAQHAVYDKLDTTL